MPTVVINDHVAFEGAVRESTFLAHVLAADQQRVPADAHPREHAPDAV